MAQDSEIAILGLCKNGGVGCLPCISNLNKKNKQIKDWQSDSQGILLKLGWCFTHLQTAQNLDPFMILILKTRSLNFLQN